MGSRLPVIAQRLVLYEWLRKPNLSTLDQDNIWLIQCELTQCTAYLELGTCGAGLLIIWFWYIGCLSSTPGGGGYHAGSTNSDRGLLPGIPAEETGGGAPAPSLNGAAAVLWPGGG